MANKVSFSNQQSSLDEIEAYYSDSERALLPKKSPHIAEYDSLSIYSLAVDIIVNIELHDS